MKYLLINLVLLAGSFGCHLSAMAQSESFDLVNYTPPRDSAGTVWTKEATGSMIGYTKSNKKNNSWCRIYILKSMDSKGTIEQDFEHDWQELIVKSYKPSKAPQVDSVYELQGWKVKAGRSNYTFNKREAFAALIAMSGYGRTVSVVVTTNTENYFDNIQAFLASIDLKQPESNSLTVVKTEDKLSASKGFTFTISNFDDGWTSTVNDDWVETTKGNTKVLIHYPNKDADAYSIDLMESLKNAWNILVAPKYSAASNLEFKPVSGYGSVQFAEADMKEKATGKTVHVVLFKKHINSGRGTYLEFITPDKKSFEQQFGVYHKTTDGWENMDNMAGYNKFAVAASDLQGKWTSNFSATQQYVNTATGLYAGMDSHASNDNFYFGPGSAYKWELHVASGRVGNLKFESAKSSGKFSMSGNWQINLSDIEGKPKTYGVYFSCIKGLRILWMDNTAYAKAE